MGNFSKEISDFQKNGVYHYYFDEGSNLVFNPKSPKFEQNYVSVPINVFIYDSTKIESFYDLKFSEFAPQKTEETKSVVSNEITSLTEENEKLKAELNSLVQNSSDSFSESERLATKQVILNLRIKLEEGLSDKDFSDTFPYLPLTRK